MEGSLEIRYYPRGFKKQKHGKDKLYNGIVIGQGRPERALKKAVEVLGALDKDINSIEKIVAKELKSFLED